MKMLIVVLLSLISIGCKAEQPPKNVEIILPQIEVVAKREIIHEPVKVEQVKLKQEEPVSTTKRVCIKVYDAKLKKEVEKCREIKIHKKYEGKKVPTKK